MVPLLTLSAGNEQPKKHEASGVAANTSVPTFVTPPLAQVATGDCTLNCGTVSASSSSSSKVRGTGSSAPAEIESIAEC